MGCTGDNYVKNVSQEKAKTDLSECHQKAFDAYNAKQKSDPTGAVIGGIFGGAIGGAIAGAATNSSDDKIDINKAIHDCMKKKGYAGESHGYN